MNKKLTITILIILLVGILFRLALTANGNFLFNMDTGRDMVDVREMVELKKLRLIGPTTAISGLYDGPAWYYLLSIPYIFSGGNPYASIIMQIILWTVGGWFLLKIVSGWNKLLVLPIGLLWIASDYIGLTTVYAFNPNPVILLTPLFIYIFSKYLETGKPIMILFTAVLAGLFFNFEMSFGVFIPIIIFCSILFSKKLAIFRSRKFWIGISIFVVFLIPQIAFNFRYQQIMSNALSSHLQREIGKVNLIAQFDTISLSFFKLFVPVILNRKLLASLLIIFSFPVLLKFISQEKKDIIVIISLCFVVIPFVGYIFLPITVSPWHLGGEMVAAIILGAFVLKELRDFNLIGKFISLSLAFFIFYFSLSNIFKFFLVDIKIPNQDPSLYKNEIAAIDYVYNYASGQNFKVYIYLPSVYDYPYQYLFWWYGKKKYGYLPIDYAYAPNKPSYIPGKESFSATESVLKERGNSNLVFLIKEPDRNYTQAGWEGSFIKLKSMSKEMVGPLEIEIRKETTRQ